MTRPPLYYIYIYHQYSGIPGLLEALPPDATGLTQLTRMKGQDRCRDLVIAGDRSTECSGQQM